MQEPELEPAAVKLDAGSATASSEPLDAAAAPIAEPPDLHKHPILEQWEYNSDGSIAGRVYGKKGFKEGEQMTTSIVPEKTRYATYVITGSGSIYRLGEKLAARVPADPKALRVRAPVDDLAAQAQQRSPRKRSAPASAAAQEMAKRPITFATGSARKESPTGKHPNQYTYRVHAPGSSSDDAKVRQPSPKVTSPKLLQQQPQQQRPKQPNQYTYRDKDAGADAKDGKPKTAASSASLAPSAAAAVAAGDSIAKPKHPNQYTYRPKLPQSPSGGADDASSAAAPFVIGVSRHAHQWTARLIRSGTDEHIGRYPTARAASDAAADLHAQLTCAAPKDSEAAIQQARDRSRATQLPELDPPPASPASAEFSSSRANSYPLLSASPFPPTSTTKIRVQLLEPHEGGCVLPSPVAEDRRFQTCEARQESCGDPLLDRALFGLGPTTGSAADDADSAAKKGGRDLRPMRPPKPPPDEVPREVLRARLPSAGGKAKREREAGDDSPTTSKGALARPGRTHQHKESQYLNNFSLERSSTRIAVLEDGVWRFQPPVGEQYQIEVEPEACCPTAAACRSRQDALVWDPARAEADGIHVPAYLAAAQKLYAAAEPQRRYSSEVALQLLHAHDFDVLAATHSMATAIGVDKLLAPDAPVVASTSLVRGRAGLRVGLHLSLRHLAASVSEGQPQGFVRSTRSRTTSLDAFPGAQPPWTAAEEAALTDGMRRDGKNLHVIHRRVLQHKTLPQVIEFFYSERGQLLKSAVMAERAAAELKAAAAAAEKAAASGSGMASPSYDGSPKKRPRADGAPKRLRADGEGGVLLGRPGKRFGPRVFAHVSVRGANNEVSYEDLTDASKRGAVLRGMVDFVGMQTRVTDEALRCAFTLADNPHIHRKVAGSGAQVASIDDAYANHTVVCLMWQLFRRKALKTGYRPFGNTDC
ncbi:hypothetical protein Ctob_007055 [Chrysochromulina tobinii]|uniref:ELM2 domain-containing protein n=1 Tax=Chrysochromulina tobinii TaxID=1460289 RepID=A0A0M0JFN0_9EUKA|nr:hypothetical protein Ctob_007055 [Chrysochromulina tobinii]|eukprot:KOO25394.1 hypothetical protein Ctob_007055 [Chrysochromulina sp. CCMP291]